MKAIWKIEPSKMIVPLLFFLSFGTISLINVQSIHVKPYEFFLAVSLLLFVYATLKKRTMPVNIAIGPILLLLIILFISSVAAQYPTQSFKQLSLVVIYSLTFFAISSNNKDCQHALLFQKTLILLALVALSYGMYDFINRSVTGNFSGFFCRPASFFTEPDEFGLMIAFVCPFVFSVIYLNKLLLLRSIVVIDLILLVLLLIPNSSRGTWISCILSTIFIMIYFHKSYLKRIRFFSIIKYTVVFLIVFFTVFTIFSKTITARWDKTFSTLLLSKVSLMFSGQDGSFNERKTNNLRSIQTFLEHPLLGIGFGNIFTILENYDYTLSDNGQYPVKYVGTSGNTFLDLAAETGILGLGTFLFFVILVFYIAYNKIRTENDVSKKMFLISAASSFFGQLVNGISYGSFMMPFLWVSAGFICYQKTSIRMAITNKPIAIIND